MALSDPRFVVTKGSNDGTFREGDHITLYPGGDIGCREAGGWINAQDAEKALEGVDMIPDPEWIQALKEEAERYKELLKVYT